MVFLKNKEGQNQFKFELITQQTLDEAFQCFLQGYLKSHPILMALKVEEDELKQEMYPLMQQALQDRPFQQILVRDILKNNKIVGVYQMGHFIQYPLQKQQKSAEQKNLSKKMQLKNFIDQKLMNSEFLQNYEQEIIKTKNPYLYQQAYVTILPEYQNIPGLFQTFTQLQFYISPKMGVKAFIDKSYNIKMAEYPMRYFDGVLLNEIDIQNIEFEGQQIFKNQKYICAKLVKTPFDSKNAKKMANNQNPEYKKLFDKFTAQNQLKPKL